jgi:NitT/TauT family transport system substrate-binding protein
MPARLGQELGYYRAGRGANVSLHDFAGGAKSLEALLGGSVDVVCGFYDHTIQMAAAGRELVSFVLLLTRPCMALISRAATRIADLRGKVIGVTAPGSSSDLLLNHIVAGAGLRREDFSVVGIGTAASAVAAITSGKVHAAMMTEPAKTFAHKRSPELHTLAETTSPEGCRAACGSDRYPSACLYTRADWLAKNRETARQLAGALLKTIRWMQTHSAQEVEASIPPELRTGDSDSYRNALATVLPVFSSDGLMPVEAPEAVRRVLAASLPHLSASSIDLQSTYTNEYVRDLNI